MTALLAWGYLAILGASDMKSYHSGQAGSSGSRRVAVVISTGVASPSFEDAVLPHIDAAYSLARWLTRNEADAEDVVQEAFLRALKFFRGFQGSDGRAWLLTIVRNTCYTWLKRNRAKDLAYDLDEAMALREDSDTPDPEATLARNDQERLVAQAIESLPIEFREVVILRELDELSYKEIADLAGIPVGTVMSRLARARKKLQASLFVEQAFSIAACSTCSPVGAASTQVMS